VTRGTRADSRLTSSEGALHAPKGTTLRVFVVALEQDVGNRTRIRITNGRDLDLPLVGNRTRIRTTNGRNLDLPLSVIELGLEPLMDATLTYHLVSPR
jgi:ribosomal protein L34